MISVNPMPKPAQPTCGSAGRMPLAWRIDIRVIKPYPAPDAVVKKITEKAGCMAVSLA